MSPVPCHLSLSPVPCPLSPVSCVVCHVSCVLRPRRRVHRTSSHPTRRSAPSNITASCNRDARVDEGGWVRMGGWRRATKQWIGLFDGWLVEGAGVSECSEHARIRIVRGWLLDVDGGCHPNARCIARCIPRGRPPRSRRNTARLRCPRQSHYRSALARAAPSADITRVHKSAAPLGCLGWARLWPSLRHVASPACSAAPSHARRRDSLLGPGIGRGGTAAAGCLTCCNVGYG